MSNSLPRIGIKANSRHPVLGRDYDAGAHRYKTGWLNASKYTLTVNAFPGTEPGTEEVIALPADGVLTKPRTITLQRLKVPPDTVAFDFSITLDGGGFSKRKSNTLASLLVEPEENQPESPWTWQVDVPGEGTYRISVRLCNKSGSGPTVARQVTVRDFLIVSIGDSYASGEGNPDVPGTPLGFDPGLKWWDVFIPFVIEYKIAKAAIEAMSNYLKREFTTLASASEAKLDMDPQPVWLEENAHRSLRSGPARAARSLEDLSEGTLVTFLSFARSGSEITDGLLGPRKDKKGNKIDEWIGNIGQVQEVKNTLRDRRIDALLISIGGNDVGFAARLTDLVSKDISIYLYNDDDEREKVENLLLQKLEQLPGEFKKLGQALETLNVRDIYLTEYPAGLLDRENGQVGRGCEIFSSDFFDADLDEQDAQLVKHTAEDLNTVLEKEAQKHGWYFIEGIAEGFKGHGYCTGENVRYFVQAEESLVVQGDTNGTMHPNDAGHQVYARQIAAAVKENTIDRPSPYPDGARRFFFTVPGFHWIGTG